MHLGKLLVGKYFTSILRYSEIDFLFMDFRVLGNPLICGQGSENNCSAVYPEPLSFPPDSLAGKYNIFVLKSLAFQLTKTVKTYSYFLLFVLLKMCCIHYF